MATIETFPGAIVRHISLSLHTRYMWPPHQIQIKTYLQRQIYISPHQMYLLTSSHTNSVLVGWLVVRLLRNKLENTDQRLRCFLSLFHLGHCLLQWEPHAPIPSKNHPLSTNTIQYHPIHPITMKAIRYPGKRSNICNTHMLPFSFHLGHRLLQWEFLARWVRNLLQSFSKLVHPSIYNTLYRDDHDDHDNQNHDDNNDDWISSDIDHLSYYSESCQVHAWPQNQAPAKKKLINLCVNWKNENKLN